jgi:hypothetical protein
VHDEHGYVDPLRPPTLQSVMADNTVLTRKLRTARLAVATLIVTLAIVAMRAWT